MSYVDVNKRFGQAIRTWRRKSAISQEELAWRAGLHRTYVADIERGARNPSLQSIHKLAKALKVSFSTLFEPLGDFPGTSRNPRTEEVRDILLVTNNSADAELMEQSFRTANVENPIHAVHDGTEALKYVFGSHNSTRGPLSHRPGLILLDLSLPKLKGIDVLRRFKEDDRTRNIPIVVLTLLQNSREMLESKRLGVENYIVKPVDFHRFSKVVPRLKAFWRLLIPLPHESTSNEKIG